MKKLIILICLSLVLSSCAHTITQDHYQAELERQENKESDITAENVIMFLLELGNAYLETEMMFEPILDDLE